MEELYCNECGEEKEIAYIGNYGGRKHYRCNKCGNGIILEHREE